MVRTTLEGWGNAYASKIPEDVRVSMEGYASQSGSVLIEAIRHVLIRTLGLLTNVVSTVIGLAVVPFMLFYLLKDRETAVEGVYSLIPPEARRHANKTLDIVNRVLGAYIRAQLTLGLIVGSMVSLGLFILGIKFSVLLGIIAGATELIPIIGPMLGAIPGVFVTLATSPEKIIWVLSLYIGLQILENMFLVPRIQSHAVGLHPAVIMIVLMVGSEAAGLWGVLLSVPLAAVGRDVFKYFHNEWGGTAAVAQHEHRPNNNTVNDNASSDETMEIS
jgi:predicted PurR-regulated permease PerM